MIYFKKLLNKIYEGKESEEEYQEFLALYESGEYDDVLTDEDLKRISLRYQPQENNVHERIMSDAHENLLSRIGDESRSVPFYKSKVWLAAAAIVVITMVAGVWFIVNERDWFNSNIAEQNDLNWPTYSGKQVINLPDGSTVTLNDNSQLKRGRGFGKDEIREVILIGEATFDVAHDPSRPFLVHTGKVTTKVLGTEFNVKAYHNQPEITVTVLRGLVEVGDEKQIYGKIRPNEQIAVNTANDSFVRQRTNAEDAVQWKSNFLILDNVSLEEAAALIKRKFNVQITFESEALKKCRFVGNFLEDESLTDVLTVISTTMQIEFEIEKDTTVTLRGNACN